MQFNPFLLSIAAPAAAKTVQAVCHAAHDIGQSFLQTLAQSSPESPTQPAVAESQSVPLQLQSFAKNFRSWLANNGIHGSFEMQFHLADNGDQISNVVGPNSEQIIDLLYSEAGWLEQLTAIAQRAQSEATGQTASGARVKLSINSSETWVSQEPAHAF